MNITIESLLQIIGRLTVEKEILAKQIEDLTKKKNKEAENENA